jgi:predicted transcriptional regulator
MATTNRKIEVDDVTAAALESRAAEQGMSVPELVAALAQSASDPVTLPNDDIAELDRRWETAGEGGLVAHADVARWLQTWGTPAFKPWRDR